MKSSAFKMASLLATGVCAAGVAFTATAQETRLTLGMSLKAQLTEEIRTEAMAAEH